jgi:hypothetical protein
MFPLRIAEPPFFLLMVVLGKKGTTCVYKALLNGQEVVAKLTDEASTTHLFYSNEKRLLRRLGTALASLTPKCKHTDHNCEGANIHRRKTPHGQALGFKEVCQVQLHQQDLSARIHACSTPRIYTQPV